MSFAIKEPQVVGLIIIFQASVIFYILASRYSKFKAYKTCVSCPGPCWVLTLMHWVHQSQPLSCTSILLMVGSIRIGDAIVLLQVMKIINVVDKRKGIKYVKQLAIDSITINVTLNREATETIIG